MGGGNIRQSLPHFGARGVHFIHGQDLGQGFFLDLLDVLHEVGEGNAGQQQIYEKQRHHHGEAACKPYPYVHIPQQTTIKYDIFPT